MPINMLANGTNPVAAELKRESAELNVNSTPFSSDFGLQTRKAGQHGGIELQHSASIKALRTQPSAVPAMGATMESALLFPGACTAKPTAEQVDENLELLHAVLHKIARLDAEKCFVEPVTEEQAPGYFQIIKQPMCLRTMHEKLDQRVYRTWRSFVDDFVLICSNAMTYNQKRSRVHRAALQLLRQGKKVLSDHELVARRALTIVHPDGPAQAALDEQQDLLTNGLALAPSSPMADDAPFAQQQTAPLAQRTASGVFHSGAGDTQGGMSLNTEELVFGYASSEDGAGYSSFSDTDLDDGEEDKGDMAALPPRTGAGVPHAEGAPFVAGTVVSHKRSPLWKGAQRDVERRCRWLELRLRGLHNAAAACRAGVSEEEEEEDPVEGDGGAAAQGGATILQVDGAATPSEGPSPPATRASLLKQQTQRRSASHRVARHMLPGLATPQDIPFVAAHLRLRHHQPKEVHPGTTEPDACVPARVYAALELVERQIAAVRKHLHATAQHHGGDDRKRGGMRGGRGGRGMPRQGSGRGRGWQGRTLGAADSFSNKRRRLEYGMHEMVAPLKLLAPKFVEKAHVAPIATPGFRTLTDTELKQRTAAVTALAKRHQLPSEVAKSLAHESSSEEDTSDEAYEQRHRQREQEEKDWYAQYTEGKNKNKRGPASKTGPSGSGAPSTAAADTTADTAAVDVGKSGRPRGRRASPKEAVSRASGMGGRTGRRPGRPAGSGRGRGGRGGGRGGGGTSPTLRKRGRSSSRSP